MGNHGCRTGFWRTTGNNLVPGENTPAMGTDKSLEELREETERTDRLRSEQPQPVTHAVSDGAVEIEATGSELELSFVTDGGREVTVEFRGDARKAI